MSVETVTDFTVLVLDEKCLDKAFDSVPRMRFVLDCLVGQDVAKKLYAVSDIVNMTTANQRENQSSQNQKYGVKSFFLDETEKSSGFPLYRFHGHNSHWR